MNTGRGAGQQDGVLVAPLQEFGRTDLRLAGGKGASLGELARAGFDVPPGFIVTTRAYGLLVNGLESPPDRSAAEMLHLIQAAAIPEEIHEEVLNAYRQMGSPAVAVRSSATAEDLPEAAFAGQQETYLNVQGERALLEAVRQCWASLWSERAVAYRARQKVDGDVKLAVVVQKMVEPEAAGVMFTANPVSGARDELVIDANPGLGEAVVAGMVTPDHFVVDRRTKRIREQQIGRREVIIRAKAGGGTEHVQDAADASRPALPEAALRAIAGLGARIERHYGAPQDIEWAWIKDGSRAGRFLILQARPMTALPNPVKVTGPMRMVLPLLVEMWPSRPYPLDMTTFTGAIERAISHLLVTIIGPSAPDPDEALTEEDGVVVSFAPPVMRPKPSILIMPWLALARTRKYDPRRWESDPLLADYVGRVRRLEGEDARQLSWSQNLDLINAALGLLPQAMELRERYIPWAGVDLGRLLLLLRIAHHGERFSALISGIPTKTTEANRALEGLAAEIRSTEALRQAFSAHEPDDLPRVLEETAEGREFLGRFHAFLEGYGHRETTLTISSPGWKDQPAYVLAILKVLAGAEPAPDRSDGQWQPVRDELLSTTALGRWPLRSFFLRWLANGRALFQIREDTHFYATMVQPIVRHAALELGRRLHDRGALDEAEDVFHLKLAEMEAVDGQWPPAQTRLDEIRALVASRKAKRASLGDRPMVDPRLLAQSGPAAQDARILLRGTSGSPGVTAGRARIIHDSTEFGRLRPGEVLVAPVTNPAWTPLFQRAAAVVVDTGGAASHAAIVAREYGIPAVMATVDGTRRLQDGQPIEVDGNRGLVLRGKEST